MMDRRRSWLWPRITQHGFTLIEILVVVVIIAIVSSIILMSMGTLRDDRDLEKEVTRMATLIELAADEATLQGRDFGLEVLRGGYRFVEYDTYTDRWTGVIGDDIFRERKLPESFEFDLTIEDRRILLTDRATDMSNDDDDARSGIETYAPHALILSSGDFTPLELTLIRRTDDVSMQVRIMPNGEVRIGKEETDFE